ITTDAASIAEPLNWLVTRTAGSGPDNPTIEGALYTSNSTVTELTLTNTVSDLTVGASYLIEYVKGGINDRAQTPNAIVTVSTPLWWNDVQLLPITAAWKYDDDNIDPGATWFETGYDD